MRLQQSAKRLIAAIAFATLLLFGPAAPAQQGGLGLPFQVNTLAPGTGDARPDVETGPAGDFLVVWESTSSSGSDTDQESIQVQRFEATGAASGGQFQLNTTTTGRQRTPSIAISDSAEAIVVWNDALDISGQRFDTSGNLLGSEFVVSAASHSESNPAIAANAGGAFTVVWQESPGIFTSRIKARRYDAAASPIGAAFQVAVETGNYFSVFAPAVSMADDGSAVIAWSRHSLDLGFVEARYDATGAPIGAEFGPSDLGACCPSIEHDAVGDFVISWDHYEFDPDRSAIRVQKFDASGSPASVVREPVSGYGHHRGSDLDVGPAGAFVVVWSSLVDAAGGTYQEAILGQRFQSNGATSGGNFQVAPYAGRLGPFSVSPAIAFDGDNRFVVVWTGDADPALATFDLNVFARRTAASKLPSLGALGLLGLAAMALALGVRSLHSRSRPLG